jgi:hypothetical protein
MEPAGFYANVLQETFEKGELPSRVIITLQVMAVSGVSPGDPDSVCPVPKRGQNELGTHPGRTGYPNDPEMRRILKAADTGQVRRAVTAPIAEKGGNPGFPLAHTLTPEHLSMIIEHLSLVTSKGV